MEFLHRLPFHGLAVLCIDDDAVRDMLPEVSRPVLTYGFSEDADVRGEALRTQSYGLEPPRPRADRELRDRASGAARCAQRAQRARGHRVATDEGIEDAAIVARLATTRAWAVASRSVSARSPARR